MPVDDHPVHPAVMREAGHLYRCHNRAPHLDTFTNGVVSWPNVFSRDCQYTIDPTGYGASDPGCASCSWQQPTKTMNKGLDTNLTTSTSAPHSTGRVIPQAVSVTCPHTTAGCNYPQGECSGACLAGAIQPETRATQRQLAAPQYLTIVYQIHSPGQVQAMLHATDWAAMSHSHAIIDRDTAIKLRDALHAELNDVQDQRREAFRAIGRLNDELGQAREQRDALLESEHNLSDAYIRLREKLDAFDTPTGPKAEQVYAHTEAKLDQLIAQRDALLEALKEAEPFLALGIRKKARAAIAKAEGAT